MTRNVYSVGQVNFYIKSMFAEDFMLNRIAVKGEVSNCKYHTSGHIYFTLKDESGVIGAVMFAGYRKGLKFRMKEGDRVIVTGSIEVYERDGRYQLYAKQIELEGEGNLYQRFEALKKELEEMGMFAPEYKQQIPKYAKRVGVVTAPTGAAVQDIRNISKRRNPYVQLILYPALVQGEGAAASVVNGIHALDALGVDVIIVGRGGGSIEDLWAFNEEIVARAIFECETPIISAVGHETDFTIADFAADMRAPTPSAAAELAVFDYRTIEVLLFHFYDRFGKNLRQKLTATRIRLENDRGRLRILSPASKLRENRKYALDLEEKLKGKMESVYTRNRHRLALLSGQLDGLSPAKKLSHGYAYVTDEKGIPIKDVLKINVSDDILVHLSKGTLRAQITEVQLE